MSGLSTESGHVFDTSALLFRNGYVARVIGNWSLISFSIDFGSMINWMRKNLINAIACSVSRLIDLQTHHIWYWSNGIHEDLLAAMVAHRGSHCAIYPNHQHVFCHVQWPPIHVSPLGRLCCVPNTQWFRWALPWCSLSWFYCCSQRTLTPKYFRRAHNRHGQVKQRTLQCHHPRMKHPNDARYHI